MPEDQNLVDERRYHVDVATRIIQESARDNSPESPRGKIKTIFWEIEDSIKPFGFKPGESGVSNIYFPDNQGKVLVTYDSAAHISLDCTIKEGDREYYDNIDIHDSGDAFYTRYNIDPITKDRSREPAESAKITNGGEIVNGDILLERLEEIKTKIQSSRQETNASLTPVAMEPVDGDIDLARVFADTEIVDAVDSGKIEVDDMPETQEDVEKEEILKTATKLLTERSGTYLKTIKESEFKDYSTSEIAQKCYQDFEKLLNIHNMRGEKDGTFEIPYGNQLSFSFIGEDGKTLKIMIGWPNENRKERYHDQYWLTQDGDASYESTTFGMKEGARDEDILKIIRTGSMWKEDKSNTEEQLRHGLRDLYFTISGAMGPKTKVIKDPQEKKGQQNSIFPKEPAPTGFFGRVKKSLGF